MDTSRFSLVNPDYSEQCQVLKEGIDYRKNRENTSFPLEEYAGFYRSFFNERLNEMWISGKDLMLLTPAGRNTVTFIIGQDKFSVGTWRRSDVVEFLRDSTSRVYGTRAMNISGTEADTSLYFFWKIDPTILKAEALLKNGALEEAEEEYLKALEINPDHYFLYDALSHIRYMKTKTRKEIIKQYKNIVGQYGPRNLWIENGRLLYKRASMENRIFYRFQLLPISETEYINLTRQNIRLEIKTDNEKGMVSSGWFYNRNEKKWIRNENDYFYKDTLINN